jgi:hypothetical protein
LVEYCMWRPGRCCQVAADREREQRDDEYGADREGPTFNGSRA